MATITVQKLVDAEVGSVWASWDDFANIDAFHPGLRSSHLLGEEQATGLGAVRQCDLADGKTYLRERITRYEQDKKMTVEIYETNAPIRQAQADFDFISVGENQTRVVMTMQFVPKMGLIGRLLTPIMKLQFTKGLSALLDGNAEYVEQKSTQKAVA